MAAVFKEFRYLVKQTAAAGTTAAASVEDVYGRDACDRVIMRDERKNRFLVFESRAEFHLWYAAVAAAAAMDTAAAAPALHEVILGTQAQLLKFDIDIPHTAAVLCGVATGAAAAAAAAAAISTILDAILDELYATYYATEGYFPAREDLAVYDSSGADGAHYKYSYHVHVLPFAVPNNVTAQAFTEKVLDRLPKDLQAIIDGSVNKRTQNFRFAGSAKVGTGRVKRLTTEFNTAAAVDFNGSHIVAASDVRVFHSFEVAITEGGSAGAGGKGTSVAPAILQSVLDLAAAATVGHELANVYGSLLCFRRVAPSHCFLCDEVHRRDNSLMICLNPIPGAIADAEGYVWCNVVERCRQKRDRTRSLGEALWLAAMSGAGARYGAADQSPSQKTAQDYLVKRVADIVAGTVNPHRMTEFERLPTAVVTRYEEPTMRDFEGPPAAGMSTLAVQAQMKLGKTKALKRYIDNYFPSDGLVPPVVTLVTFRQTFGRSIADAFPSFELYSDITGDIELYRHPRLIVQVESLHRIKMPYRAEPVDLLVLDEIESVLEQFGSGLHRHFTAAFAMFTWMLRTARHVVCMDANLSDRTYRTLERMRPGPPLKFHWNAFARAAHDTYAFMTDQKVWLERLYEALRAEKKIVIPTNSLSEARALDEALRREFPAKRIFLYSSETSPSEKARHFADVHTYWGELDVLIYTPTCSAGVSFERPHFDVLFGFFCDTSCNVETCRQMLGRVRTIQDYQICFRAARANLPTDPDEIRQLIHDKRSSLYLASDASLLFEYGVDGRIQHYESQYFNLWIENLRITNLSKNSFVECFVDQVADTGASITVVAAAEAADGAVSAGAALLMNHRTIGRDLKAARCVAVAVAPDFNIEAVTEVREMMAAGQDVTPEARLACEKFYLRAAYRWQDRPIDAAFVATYQPAPVRRVYQNLCDVTSRESIAESLTAIRVREFESYSQVMAYRSGDFISEGPDINRDRTYVYQSHHLATWAIRACGFSGIFDQRRVCGDSLAAGLRAALPMFLQDVKKYIYEFNATDPRFDRLAHETDQARFLKKFLKFINGASRFMYGIEVAPVPRMANVFTLRLSVTGKLFDFGGEDPQRPYIGYDFGQRAGPAHDDNLAIFMEANFYENLGLADADMDPQELVDIDTDPQALAEA